MIRVIINYKELSLPITKTSPQVFSISVNQLTKFATASSEISSFEEVLFQLGSLWNCEN